MINEEMQKAMEFIVEQQALFAANMQRFEERQVKAEERVSGVEERMTKIENVMLRLANVQVDTVKGRLFTSRPGVYALIETETWQSISTS